MKKDYLGMRLPKGKSRVYNGNDILNLFESMTNDDDDEEEIDNIIQRNQEDPELIQIQVMHKHLKEAMLDMVDVTDSKNGLSNL